MTGIMDFMKYFIWWSSLDCVILIRVVVRKKRDYVGKIPKLGGRGLTHPHFLMSIYQVIFGMPKWLPTNLACHLSWRKTGICGKHSQQRGGVTYSQRNCFLWGQNCDFLVKTKNVPEVLKWKINPTFFLITGVSQTGGGGGPPLGNFSHIIPFFFWPQP